MTAIRFYSAQTVDPIRFRVGANPIGNSIYKMLKGIQGEWGLIDSEMADILQRTPSTYGTWGTAQSVSISVDRPSANDQTIFAFIDIFDLVSSLIYREEQRREWIRKPNPALGGKSPLEIMRNSAEALFEFRHYLQRLINP
jgi:hypothetical protein